MSEKMETYSIVRRDQPLGKENGNPIVIPDWATRLGLQGNVFFSIMVVVVTYSMSLESGEVTLRDYTLSKAMDFGWPYHIGAFCTTMSGICLAWQVLVRFFIVHLTLQLLHDGTPTITRYLHSFALLCGLVSAWAMGAVGIWNVDFQRQLHAVVTVISIFSTQFYLGCQLFLDNKIMSLGAFGSPAPAALWRWFYVRLFLWCLFPIGQLGNFIASIFEIPLHPQSHTWSSAFEVLLIVATMLFYITLLVGPSTGYSGELYLACQGVPETGPCNGHKVMSDRQLELVEAGDDAFE